MGPRHASAASVVAMFLLSALIAAPAAAADPQTLTFDIGGRPIDVADVSSYHCHDLDYPVIHCFLTSSEVDRAVDVVSGSGDRADGGATLLAVSYVRIFEHASFDGGSMYLSTNYSNLGSIGWNDRISSYIVVNDGSGSFYTDANWAGARDSFCCNELVAYVGDFFNDKFSSVERTGP